MSDDLLEERRHCKAALHAAKGNGSHSITESEVVELLMRERADAVEKALKKAEHLVEQHRIETGWTTAIKLLDEIRALR